MEDLEATTQPFVVRIWLEESAQEGGRATWRGHITHMPSGARQYIRDLDEIRTFIAPYLEAMGVHPAEPGPGGRRPSWMWGLWQGVRRAIGAGRRR